MPDPKIYNWGFVAAGGMAHQQARELALSPRNRVGGVVSRTEQSTQAFAKAFEAKPFSSFEKMLASADIDVIYISSPNNLHYSQTKLALEAGKPVLCEKPFTLNAPQLGELISIARQSKNFLMEAMWIRFLPAIVKLRQLLADGEIGKIQSVTSSLHYKLPFVPEGRIYNLSLGGGSLLDLGIYPISFVSMVMGAQPAKIESTVELAETGVDTSFEATFDYKDGAKAHVSAGVDVHLPVKTILESEQGRIRIEGDHWKFNRLFLEKQGQPRALIEEPLDGDGYSYQAEEVARCLDLGLPESPSLPLDESLEIIRTLDAIRKEWNLVFPGE